VIKYLIIYVNDKTFIMYHLCNYFSNYLCKYVINQGAEEDIWAEKG
jgi:hypothetical protein